MSIKSQNSRSETGPWDKVAKRLQSRARGLIRGGNGNYGILRITVLIDCSGYPIGWNNPIGERLEPGGEWPLELLDSDKEAT